MAVNLNEIPPASDFNPAEVEDPDVDLTKPNNIADDGTPKSVMVANLGPKPYDPDDVNAAWVKQIQGSAKRLEMQGTVDEARRQLDMTNLDKKLREMRKAIDVLEVDNMRDAADAMKFLLDQKIEALTLLDCQVLLKMIYADKTNSERESSNA